MKARMPIMMPVVIRIDMSWLSWDSPVPVGLPKMELRAGLLMIWAREEDMKLQSYKVTKLMRDHGMSLVRSMLRISKPRSLPITWVITRAATTMTRPITALVMRFLAISSWVLSPAELIQVMAPMMIWKINQIPAATVRVPIMVLTRVAKVPLGWVKLLAKGPVPSRLPIFWGT